MLIRPFASLICSSILLASIGCDGDSVTASAAASAAAQGAPGAVVEAVAAQAGFAVGRVTLEGGAAITGDIQDYQISIYGVSEAGEKISYSPIIKNGVYKQKLVPGQYGFEPSKIKVRFGQTDYRLPLVPVGNNWNKNQDAADGIVQDFLWKPTGLRDTYGDKPDPNNHTHWHGMSIGMRYSGWREDTGKAAVTLPEGTKMTFTLTPKSKSIDGRDLQPIVIERAWRFKDTIPTDDLNDIPPANYEITGVLTLPDGTTKAIVFQGRGNYPGFVDKGDAPLETDGYGGCWKQLFTWGIN